MKARYYFLMHCLDDKFKGPETIPLDQFEADVTFEKAVEQGPGKLRVQIDLHVQPGDILFGKRGNKGWQIPPHSMTEKVQRVANFIEDVLEFQTGFGQIEDSQGNTEFHDSFYDDAFFEYLPESAEERQRVADSLRFGSATMTIRWKAYTGDLIRFKEFSTLAQHPDVVAIVGEASRLKYVVSKYRELYRVIDYFSTKLDKIPGTNKSGSDKPLERISKYMIRFDQKYNLAFFKSLKNLRKQCSHTVSDYITPNNIQGLNALKARIPDLQEIAKTLLNDPPV